MWAWAEHDGAARTLVRRLKYEGVAAVAHLVAPGLARLVPAAGTCLVPVPRTPIRRIRYGVDPAATLAAALSLHSGLPVVHALAPPLWHPPNAGSARRERRPPRLTARRVVHGAVLVDDVSTTGATLDAAAEAVGFVHGALTITAVP